MKQINTEKDKCAEKINHFLNWSIRPDNNSYYPVLRCYKGYKPIYETGLIKDKNGKTVRLPKWIGDFTPLETANYGDTLFCIYNAKDIYEQVIKDFKVSEADKPHLWKFLTDFSIEQFFNAEISIDFLNFLYKYNFRISLLQ